jgi:hypothetical protein
VSRTPSVACLLVKNTNKGENGPLQKIAEHGGKRWIKPLFGLFLKNRKIFVRENFAKKK